MSTITTIAFDYGGVLARRIDDEYVCHMAHAAGANPDRFIPALWNHRDKYDAGELDAPSYWQAVMTESGANEAARENLEETIDTLMQLDALGWATIQPGMVRWLTSLRRAGYRRLIISNMSVEMREYLLEGTTIGTYFDTVVISGDLGINKPDRRIFESASKRVATPLEEILFIDDLAHNVEGAIAAGMQAIQFADPASFSQELREQHPEIPATGLMCG